MEEKNPAIAALLSFLFSGLGQIYNGELGKGIFFILIHIAIVPAAFLLIGIPALILFWIYNIYDAHTTATRLSRARSAKKK